MLLKEWKVENIREVFYCKMRKKGKQEKVDKKKRKKEIRKEIILQERGRCQFGTPSLTTVSVPSSLIFHKFQINLMKLLRRGQWDLPGIIFDEKYILFTKYSAYPMYFIFTQGMKLYSRYIFFAQLMF